ncbi:MAG: hypothetical protein A3K65_08525 [Euryarchaeota archaeon RBG_16_68_12]|nr:MAG: hypothetical protein A3K65_08525 [Euryarchaeota archaeon RBG_16_68_12]
MARKPIKTSIDFEARFPVKGRVLWAVMCDHCEAEGELRIRMARDPTKGWDYRLDDKGSFVDVHAVDASKSYDKVRAGEWVAGTLIVFGCLKKVWAREVSMEGSVLEDGTRLTGEVSLGDVHAQVDFGLFRAFLRFENAAQMKRVLKYEGIKDGSFVATDVQVDVKVERWGRKDDVLRGKARR